MERKKSIESHTQNHMAWIVGLAGWMIPGAGHFIQKRFIRGTVLSSIVLFMFILGIQFGGTLSTPFDNDPTGSGFLQILKSFANIGNGVIYLLGLTAGIGSSLDPKAAEASTFEYGNTFTLVSGLLNYLIALDAFDIYVGRKE